MPRHIRNVLFSQLSANLLRMIIFLSAFRSFPATSITFRLFGLSGQYVSKATTSAPSTEDNSCRRWASSGINSSPACHCCRIHQPLQRSRLLLRKRDHMLKMPSTPWRMKRLMAITNVIVLVNWLIVNGDSWKRFSVSRNRCDLEMRMPHITNKNNKFSQWIKDHKHNTQRQIIRRPLKQKMSMMMMTMMMIMMMTTT